MSKEHSHPSKEKAPRRGPAASLHSQRPAMGLEQINDPVWPAAGAGLPRVRSKQDVLENDQLHSRSSGY